MQSPKSIKKLKQLYLQEYYKKFENPPPPGARTAPRYTDKDESGLIQCIKDYINLTGGQAERINPRGRRIDKRKQFTDVIGNRREIGSVKYIPTTMRKGTADISATIKGLSVKIEVKIGSDRQSKDQKAYQAEIERAGGIYMIVRSFDDFLEKLEKYSLNNMENAIKL
jgi:hypothetical protein